MVKGIYFSMICNFQFSGGSQDLDYIHALLMDPEFVFVDNLMLQMMENLSQMLKISKGKPDTPTLAETMT